MSSIDVMEAIQPVQSPEASIAQLPDNLQSEGPLSYEQKGLWYIQKTNPACGAYNLLFSARLFAPENLAVSKLHTILQSLCTRHAALRTYFSDDEEGTKQVVAPEVTPEIRVIDATSWNEDSLVERIRLDNRDPFKLDAAPLWRVHLYNRGNNEWLVAVVVHHIVVDFWSFALLLTEVIEQIKDDTVEQKAVASSSYLDFSHAQNSYLDSAAGIAELEYWRKNLAGAAPVLNLPFDRPRPPFQTFSGASIAFTLDAGTSDALKELARKEGVTLFMLILAAYNVMLHKYSGECDVLVGTPVAGRQQRKFRSTIGNFVNSVVLRTAIDPMGTNFLTLAGQVRETVIGALKNQELPFAHLVKALSPVRDPSHSPIYQVAFNWEKLPVAADLADFFVQGAGKQRVNFGMFEAQPFHVPQQEGQVDLLLEMGGEVNNGLTGAFKYNTDLFDAVTIEQMALGFATLVKNIVVNPDVPIAQLSVLTDDMRSKLLLLGQGPVTAYPACGIHNLVAQQAAKTPDSVALVFGTHTMTYAQLERKSNQLALDILARGVKASDCVGLHVDRAVDMVVGLLGILKSGAAYVPLDPSFPAERLRYMVENSGMSMIVTQSQHLEFIKETGCNALLLDQMNETGVDGAGLPTIKPEDCAYILYTSGSTGLPKGVRVSHRSVVNFLLSMQQKPGLVQSDVLLAVTTLSFDIAVLEIYLPLISGARVIIASKEMALDGTLLVNAMTEHSVSMMQATPATWQLLISSGWTGGTGLKALCGGEALPPSLAQELCARCGSVWNMYGPTETTVWSTVAQVLPGEPVLLGQPIANTQLYVLDEGQRMVPAGVLGELCIGGDGVAMDYFKRPDLTSAQFLSGIAGLPADKRIYRTGDRVRFRQNGALEHHGRLDNQIKLRGFRIELGEIETVLRNQESIKDAVVVVREDTVGDARIVAYLIPRDGAEISVSALRDELRQTLPAYMVPSAFVSLDEFPLTPNKKINRKALPAPTGGIEGRKELVAPRDAMEMRLARMWRELLKIEDIGIHDNFFDLGGHSLLAAQLMAMIKRECEIELPVSELLQNSTIEMLAQKLRSGESSSGEDIVVCLRRDTGGAPLFMPHPIGGNVFCYLELLKHISPGRPVYALQAPGLDIDDGAEVEIETMATRYLTEIRKIQPHGPYYFTGWCFGGSISFEMSRQLTAVGEETALLAMLDTRAPIPDNVPDDGDDATLLSWFARDLAGPFGKVLNIPPELLRELPAEDMFDYVLREAKAIQVVAEDADRNQMHRYFEVYIANGIALQLYTPEPTKMDVLLFKARDELEDFGSHLGWDKLITGNLDMIITPGDHTSIMYSPNIQLIAEVINQRILQIEAKGK